jgi:hypothetical protein
MSRTEIPKIDVAETRRWAERSRDQAVQAWKAGRREDAKDAWRQAAMTIAQVIRGKCLASDISYFCLAAYNYAYLQGIDAGVERELFNMESNAPMVADPDVQKGLAVIIEVCNLIELDLETLKSAIPGELLARCLQLSGAYDCVTDRLDHCIRVEELALQLFDENATDERGISYDILGMAHYRRSDAEQAVKWFGKAVTAGGIESVNPGGRRGRLARAEQALARAADASPQNVPGQKTHKWSFRP